MDFDLADYDFGPVVSSLESPAFNLSDVSQQIVSALPSMAEQPWWSQVGDIARQVGGAAGGTLGTIGSIAKTALPAVQIGTGIMGAIGSRQLASDMARQGKLAREAQRQQLATSRRASEQIAAPAVDFGKAALERAAAGTIPDAQRARIEEWKSGALQLARDYFARNNISDSTMMASMESWIDKQAKAMEMASLEGQQSLGLQALGQASGAVAAGAGAAGAAGASAMQQQASLEDLIRAANEQLSRMSAGAS